MQLLSTIPECEKQLLEIVRNNIRYINFIFDLYITYIFFFTHFRSFVCLELLSIAVLEVILVHPCFYIRMFVNSIT